MKEQHTGETSRRRVLVVANETIEGQALHEAICRSAQDHGSEVLVIAPALNSRLKHWASDEDAARQRLMRCIDLLADEGVRAIGYVGDANPLQAIADGLGFFPADEIIVATHPEQRSNWLAKDLVLRACYKFGLPVLHVIVHDVRDPETLVLEAA